MIAFLIIMYSLIAAGLLWCLWMGLEWPGLVAEAKARATAAGAPETYLLDQILAFTDMGGHMCSGELELMQREVVRVFGRRAWPEAPQ